MLFYQNRLYESPNELPPCLILGHGGPTGYASPTLDMKKQYFTSRGFAVLDVNVCSSLFMCYFYQYRGSSGYGSKFRHALKGQWGVVDRDDILAAIDAVAASGLVDGSRICVMGSSAGGFLVLACLLHSQRIHAGVCTYAVSDLIRLAEVWKEEDLESVQDTHKFEKGYNEALLGKLPEQKDIYLERSPIVHVHKVVISCE